MITIAIPSSRCRRSISARICAWTVTSSAVVGSSAISSLGSLASAIAIITRWRMPPENSCGYSSTRLARVGDADQPEQLDRALAGLRLGDVAVGADRLDELLADLVERVQRGQRVLEDHRDVVAPDRAQLVFGQRHEVAARRTGSARRCRAPWRRVRPSVVSEETVLPEPDSPTMPSVLPACTW